MKRKKVVIGIVSICVIIGLILYGVPEYKKYVTKKETIERQKTEAALYEIELETFKTDYVAALELMTNENFDEGFNIIESMYNTSETFRKICDLDIDIQTQVLINNRELIEKLSANTYYLYLEGSDFYYEKKFILSHRGEKLYFTVKEIEYGDYGSEYIQEYSDVAYFFNGGNMSPARDSVYLGERLSLHADDHDEYGLDFEKLIEKNCFTETSGYMTNVFKKKQN